MCDKLVLERVFQSQDDVVVNVELTALLLFYSLLCLCDIASLE